MTYSNAIDLRAEVLWPRKSARFVDTAMQCGPEDTSRHLQRYLVDRAPVIAGLGREPGQFAAN